MSLPHPDQSGRPLRVLVVDDDPLQLRTWQRSLRRHNVEFALATNAVDALLQIGAEHPDLVVMDVFMPGLDGIEACRKIKANPRTRDVQVVLASGTMTPDLARAAELAGASRTMSKPVDIQQLLAPVETAASASGEAPAAEPEAAPKVRGADLLVGLLAEAGVDVVFGLPGGAISPVHDALLDSSIRVVTTRHEAGAMFAAASYARTTGKLGVVAVTSGPGALNAMTGLASAWCDGLPVMLLVGEVPRAAHGKGVLQDGSAHGLQIVEMARHVAKLAAEVPRASALPHLARRAIATALSGRRGPVALTLPLDVTTAMLHAPRAAGTVTLGEHVDPALLDELIDLLVDAERPLVLAGSGVRGHGAPARLRAVAERLGCRVATTPKAKGVFPEDHPLALGVLGLGGHPSAQTYLEAGVDVVVAIGTSLGDLATNGFSPQLQASRALVHVDIDARQIGKSYAPTLAIVASAAELLGGLSERLDGRDSFPAGSAAAGRRGVVDARAVMPRPMLGPPGVTRHVLPPAETPGRIAPHVALAELQAVMPPGTIFTVDAGEHTAFAMHYLELTEPDAFVVMTGLGSMGPSIGAAIGAKLARPDRAVAAIVGDGCFAMNGFEIATAVAERLPIRVFVFNDHRLGMVENGHETVYGRRPDYSTGALDICAIARALGAETLRVDGPGQLADADALLRDAPGPVIVDVQIDPTIALPKRDRVAAMSLPDQPPPTTTPPAPPTPTPPKRRRPTLRLVN